jgi:uncharacterized protein (DUF1684 family)
MRGLKILTFAVILLLSSAPLMSQDESSAPEPVNTDKLIDLIYTIKDFQTRFTRALEANEGFVLHHDNADFVEILKTEVASSALKEYGVSVIGATTQLSQVEVDSLITVLGSPYGNVIRKLFELDNSEVERDLALYVNRVVGGAVTSLRTRDSLLFEKQFPFDLKEVMSGSYVDSINAEGVVKVERTETLQTETLNGSEYKFKINWWNNSKYAIVDVAGNPTSLGEELPVNIYEIDGDDYKYIWKAADGSYGKHVLRRTSYASYEDEVKAFKWSLYDKYASDFTSPLSASEIELFKASGGHQHFDINKKFKVSAEVVKEPNENKTITLETSDGREKTYTVYGTATFKLKGKKLTLDLYQPVATPGKTTEHRLFLPFRDGSSGDKTYGGGRYIDLDVPSGDQIIIDFNKSYNPYCAYTDGYSCPIPPEENSLEIAIEAGIKTPKLK